MEMLATFHFHEILPQEDGGTFIRPWEHLKFHPPVGGLFQLEYWV